MSLSDKRISIGDMNGISDIYQHEDIKQAVQELKELIFNRNQEDKNLNDEIINEIFGEDLI